jgi:hypothetical protein
MSVVVFPILAAGSGSRGKCIVRRQEVASVAGKDDVLRSESHGKYSWLISALVDSFDLFN